MINSEEDIKTRVYTKPKRERGGGGKSVEAQEENYWSKQTNTASCRRQRKWEENSLFIYTVDLENFHYVFVLLLLWQHAGATENDAKKCSEICKQFRKCGAAHILNIAVASKNILRVAATNVRVHCGSENIRSRKAAYGHKNYNLLFLDFQMILFLGVERGRASIVGLSRTFLSIDI